MENLSTAAARLIAEVTQRSCPEHGDYQSRKLEIGGESHWAPCLTCMERESRERVQQQDDFRKEATRKRIMDSASIPYRFAERTLENYIAKLPGQQKALSVATDYAAHFAEALSVGRSLIFCGKAGTGKTHLAVGIAKKVIESGKTATFTTAMDAIRKVRETYRKTSELTEREVINSFAEADLTIIDEVGSQLGTDAEKVTLFELVNARYERLRPMIVLSNLTITEVEQYMGTRAFDRLRENGGQLVPFPWDSFRRGAQ